MVIADDIFTCLLRSSLSGGRYLRFSARHCSRIDYLLCLQIYPRKIESQQRLIFNLFLQTEFSTSGETFIKPIAPIPFFNSRIYELNLRVFVKHDIQNEFVHLIHAEASYFTEVFYRMVDVLFRNAVCLIDHNIVHCQQSRIECGVQSCGHL